MGVSFESPESAGTLSFVCMCCIHRVDSVSSSQDEVKSREFGSGPLYDALASSCPEQPAVPSNVYAAADAHQEEGKACDQPEVPT